VTPSRRKLTVSVILSTVPVVVIFSYIFLHFLVQSTRFRAWIQTELGQRTGYEVRIGSLRLSPPLQIVASTIVVSKGGEAVFQGNRIILVLTPLDLVFRRIHRLSVEKPTVRVNLKDLFKPSERFSPNLSIRTLNIEDGEFVLATDDGESFMVRSIRLSAKNLNLGGKTGVLINAYLPWLDGDADIQIQGPSEVREAEIHIRQRSPGLLAGLLQKKDQAAGVLTAHLKLKEARDKSYEMDASGNLHEFRVGTEKISGDFKSRLDLDAELKGVRVFAQLSVRQFPSKIGRLGLSLPAGPAAVTIAGRYSIPEKVLTMQGIKMAAPFGSAEGKGNIVLAADPATLNTTLQLHDVSLNLLKQLLPESISSLGISGMASADLHLSGPFNSLAVKGVAHSEGAKVQAEKFNLSHLSVRVPFEFAKSSIQAKGMHIEGKGLTLDRKGEVQFEAREMSFDGDMGKSPNGFFKTEGQFQIVQGRFSTPDGSKVGEQLAARGNFSLASGLQDNRIPFKGKVEIAGLELLWGKFFGNFKEQRPIIEIEGDYLPEKDEVRLGPTNIIFRSMGNVELKGVIKGLSEETVFHLDGRAEDFHPAGFYDFFIRDTFKESHPLLGKLTIDGRSSLVVRTQGSLKEFIVEGALRLQDGEIREKSDRWRIGPMQMALPFKFQYPRAVQKKEGEQPQMASLAVQAAKLASTTIPTIRMSFSFWNNSLQFAEPIHIPLYGGSVVVKDLVWRDVVGAPKNLSFSVAVDDIRLLELTEALGWYRVGGNLSGSIPQVQFVGNSLHSRGEVKLNVFEGHVLIKGLEIQEPFSSLPSIKMDLWLDEINLERVSETFEFGRISGILQGTIEQLVVTQGQAAQFKADVHTVEKQGVSQWISVEALDKITVLSSGNEAGFLYGGLAGFFDYFRYSELGFKASLKNDKLSLRGIESKEGQEYLVIGTFLPPTVNIISHTQEIAFTELMRRLERVRESGKAAQPSK